MTRKELETIKRTYRWPVKLSDFYGHYFFIVFPLAITAIGFAAAFSGFKNDVAELKLLSIIISIIGLFLTFFVAKRLYQNHVFEIYAIDRLTSDTIKRALKNIKLNSLKYYKLGYFQATTNTSWFSWGETITIVPANDRVLINSRPTGSAFSFQPITISRDRSNIKKIIDELNLAVNREVDKETNDAN